jgi:hypothetical protein
MLYAFNERLFPVLFLREADIRVIGALIEINPPTSAGTTNV